MQGKVNVPDDVNPAVIRVRLELHLKKRMNAAMKRREATRESHFGVNKLNPPHEVLYRRCRAAKSKGFPLSFQCRPSLKQKMSPEQVGLRGLPCQ